MKKAKIIGLVLLVSAFVVGYSLYACSGHTKGSAECEKAHETGECKHESNPELDSG